MAMAADNGQRVLCITATYGEDGVQDENRWPRASIRETRQKELERSCVILGVDRHYYLGIRDGMCKDSSFDRSVDQIVQIIKSEKPDTILTFGPSGSTGHPDHIAVYRWVSAAHKLISQSAQPRLLQAAHAQTWYESTGKLLDEQFRIFFKIDKPLLVTEKDAAVYVRLPRAYIDKKRAALHAQESQMARLFEQAPTQYIDDLCQIECFTDAD